MNSLPDPLPPNHNPLIGSMPIDTLNNVLASLVTLRDLYLIPQSQQPSSVGLYFFVCAMVDALEFETEYRGKREGE